MLAILFRLVLSLACTADTTLTPGSVHRQTLPAGGMAKFNDPIKQCHEVHGTTVSVFTVSNFGIVVASPPCTTMPPSATTYYIMVRIDRSTYTTTEVFLTPYDSLLSNSSLIPPSTYYDYMSTGRSGAAHFNLTSPLQQNEYLRFSYSQSTTSSYSASRYDVNAADEQVVPTQACNDMGVTSTSPINYDLALDSCFLNGKSGVSATASALRASGNRFIGIDKRSMP